MVKITNNMNQFIKNQQKQCMYMKFTVLSNLIYYVFWMGFSYNYHKAICQSANIEHVDLLKSPYLSW